MTDQDRRITRLENTLNGLGPDITQLSVDIGNVSTVMASLEKSINSMQEAILSNSELKLLQAKCSATQVIRWEEHRRLHDELTKVLGNIQLEINNLANSVVSNKIGLAKVAGVGGISGLVVAGLIELVKLLV